MGMTWDWSGYLAGGGARPDAISGLSDPFEASLAQMFANAPDEIRQNLRVTSAYRSPERQRQLWDEALKKYGSPEAARKWVAPPGNSKHNHGSAVDLKYLDQSAEKWVHDNASAYGLYFPMGHEPWHIEPIGSRGGQNYQHSAEKNTQPAYGNQTYAPQNALAVQDSQPDPRAQYANALAMVQAMQPQAVQLDPAAFQTRSRPLNALALTPYR